jgi:phage N-6-adenine-methyltransferase
MADLFACLSTGKDDWETPDDLFARYDASYHFTLDAAANERNHKCPRWYGPGGIVEDALLLEDEWPLDDRIWLNPPYSRGLQTRFVKQAALCGNHGGLVVCLLPARTDTKLFHEVIQPFGKIEFLKGRVKFINPDSPLLRKPTPSVIEGRHAPNNTAPFPSMIVVFGRQ